MDKQDENQPVETVVEAPPLEETAAPEPAVIETEPAKKQKRNLNLSKKQLIIGSAIAVAVAIFGVSAYFAFTHEDKQAPVASEQTEHAHMGASVLLIDGSAYRSTDGESWDELAASDSLKEGDYVRTEPLSRLIINLDDGSAVRLAESTTVQLTSLEADNIQINNQAGQVYSRVVTSERSFAVVVEETSYAALGTAFQTINTAENKGVQVLQSKVQAEETEVDEGKQYYKSHANSELVEKVTDVPVDELKNDAFMLWNLEQDEKSDEFKDKLGYWEKVKSSVEEQPAEEEDSPSAGISLSGSKSDKGTVLSWTATGLNTAEGFKIVRSTSTSSPVYGKDEAVFVSGKSRSYTWGTSKAGTYTYRVCRYVPSSSTCNFYSNPVTVESVYIAPEAVVPGAVTLSVDGSGTLSWTFAGTAPHGFKVVSNTTGNPSYPKDSIHYGTSPYTFKKTTSGTYYFKVCKYTASGDISGGCTDYSNQVQYTIP